MLRQVKPYSQPFRTITKEKNSKSESQISTTINSLEKMKVKQQCRSTKMTTVNNVKSQKMAKLKSEVDKWISMPDKDYLELIEDHILMTALRAAGLERLPIYKSAQSILKNRHIEVHLKPIKPQYK